MARKFGPKLKEVQAATIASRPAADLAAKVQAGQPFELNGFTLDPSDVVVTLKAPDGWAGVADHGTQVVIDARITSDLKREGMARDVIRHVPQSAQGRGFMSMEDRIVLYLHTESVELRQAIETHRDYIARETLTVQWASAPLDGAASANVKIEGQALTIQLRKAT